MTESRVAAPAVVLIAEDEEPIALAIAYIVEELGYATVIAAHGKQALDMARASHPALIITDLMMPQMSGAEFIRALRDEAAHEHSSTPPIIVMTAAGKQHVEAVHADAFIPKPFDIVEVEALLERYLAGPRDEQTAARRH